MAKATQASRDYKAGRQKENRAYISAYKSLHKCKICGEGRSICLVFHHRDPSQKSFELSRYKSKSISTLDKEFKKCDVLCANCHLALHGRLMIEQAVKDESFSLYD